MKTVDTGIAIELPQGTMGLIKPKSGHNRLVGAGVVDESYRGEIKVKVYNTGHNNIYLHNGDPVAQLVVVPILTPELELVPYKELQETERGTTGGINQ
jgi:dUTP pyrophosphatase